MDSFSFSYSVFAGEIDLFFKPSVFTISNAIKAKSSMSFVRYQDDEYQVRIKVRYEVPGVEEEQVKTKKVFIENFFIIREGSKLYLFDGFNKIAIAKRQGRLFKYWKLVNDFSFRVAYTNLKNDLEVTPRLVYQTP
jgi:hypothetical protein